MNSFFFAESTVNHLDAWQIICHVGLERIRDAGTIKSIGHRNAAIWLDFGGTRWWGWRELAY
jgi:hypothetical protein